MDKVADAVGKDCEKPKFYYAEQSQQNKYTCQACSELMTYLGGMAIVPAVVHITALMSLKMI